MYMKHVTFDYFQKIRFKFALQLDGNLAHDLLYGLRMYSLLQQAVVCGFLPSLNPPYVFQPNILICKPSLMLSIIIFPLHPAPASHSFLPSPSFFGLKGIIIRVAENKRAIGKLCQSPA